MHGYISNAKCTTTCINAYMLVVGTIYITNIIITTH